MEDLFNINDFLKEDLIRKALVTSSHKGGPNYNYFFAKKDWPCLILNYQNHYVIPILNINSLGFEGYQLYQPVIDKFIDYGYFLEDDLFLSINNLTSVISSGSLYKNEVYALINQLKCYCANYINLMTLLNKIESSVSSGTLYVDDIHHFIYLCCRSYPLQRETIKGSEIKFETISHEILIKGTGRSELLIECYKLNKHASEICKNLLEYGNYANLTEVYVCLLNKLLNY